MASSRQDKHIKYEIIISTIIKKAIISKITKGKFRIKACTRRINPSNPGIVAHIIKYFDRKELKIPSI